MIYPKKLFVSFTIALGLSTTASAQGTFKLTINIKNAEGEKVSVQYGRQPNEKDSAVVKDGRIEFAGNLQKPYAQAFIVFGNYDPYSRDNKYTSIYLDAGSEATLTADLNDLGNAVATGGKTQSEANELKEMTATASNPLKALNAEYDAAEGEQGAAIREKMEPYHELYKASVLCFVKTHPDSYVSAEQMPMLMSEMKYEEIKAIYDRFTPAVQASEAGKEIADEVAPLAHQISAAEAPDFTDTDINGQSFTLSSLKGKVVIIDFWASWCVPCRKSNPHMLEVYQKYHDQGLEMVYVSDDDSNPDAWRKAVEKDQLTAEGFHHVLRGLKWDRSKGIEGLDHTNDISYKYAIHMLPTKYLIDREGKIVCKIGEEEESMLDLYLATLLK